MTECCTIRNFDSLGGGAGDVAMGGEVAYGDLHADYLIGTPRERRYVLAAAMV